MQITQADMDRLTARAAEILDPEAGPVEVEKEYRDHRVRYFTRLWERVSSYAEASVDDTIVKGEIPSAVQRAELYSLQMHAIVMTSIFCAVKELCVGHFSVGFLDAAERSAVMDTSDLPWFASLDLDRDLTSTSDAVTRGYAEAKHYACVAVRDGLDTEQRMALIAARNKDAVIIIPGFRDPRLKSTDTIRGLDVDPHRLPNKPTDEVDYVQDVLVGLQKASTDSKMKQDAHEAIAQRVALRELRLWRAHYFRLEV